MLMTRSSQIFCTFAVILGLIAQRAKAFDFTLDANSCSGFLFTITLIPAEVTQGSYISVTASAQGVTSSE